MKAGGGRANGDHIDMSIQNSCTRPPSRGEDAKVLTLVTGNSSWWKARKYRRETAARLWALRAEGWRLCRIERMARRGVDTRLFTRYTLWRKPGVSDR